MAVPLKKKIMVSLKIPLLYTMKICSSYFFTDPKELSKNKVYNFLFQCYFASKMDDDTLKTKLNSIPLLETF